MKKAIKKTLSLLLCIMMTISAFLTTVVAEENPTIVVQTVRTNPGGSTDVSIQLHNCPGIATAILKVSYDNSILTLNSFDYGSQFQSGGEAPQSLNSPLTLAWSTSEGNVTGNVTYAVLHFSVKEDAEPNSITEVKVTYHNSDIVNFDEEDVNFEIQNGGIEIVNGIPGDINGDREVNAKDFLRMRKYFSGWNVEVDMVALDINGDGEVNAKDFLRGRKYFSGWNVEIYYGSIVHTQCNHNMIAVAAKEATCEEQGNHAYWMCSNCLKYFSDAEGLFEISANDFSIPATGHTPEEMYLAPTSTSEGYENGWQCSTCGKVLTEPTPIPILSPETSSIIYKISGTDAYLKELEIAGEITNNPNNPNVYEHGKITNIVDIVDGVEEHGYQFLGWYDSPEGGNRITRILADQTGTVVLYAHWLSSTYQVLFNYDTVLEGLIDTSSLKNVTGKSNEVKTLPILYLDGYTFVGWSDENGNICRTIPAGNTENKTFYANWLSQRNRAWTAKSLEDPVIYEDDSVIVFAYPIGKVTDVPVYEIENFGYLNASGVGETITKEVSVQTSSDYVKAYSTAIESSTTGNATWTLSNGWTDSVSISQEYADELNRSKEEIEEESKTETNEWYVNTTTGGSNTSTIVDTTDTYDLHTKTANTKTYDTHTNTHGYEVNGKLSIGGGKDNTISKALKKVFNIGLEVGGSYENKTTDKTGRETELGGSDQTGTLSTHSSTSSNVSTWNMDDSYSNGESTTNSRSVANAISQTINQKSAIGNSYLKTGSDSTSRGLSSTNGNKDEFSSKVTYSNLTYEKTSVTYSTGAAITGYHRKVMAATAYVYGVVGYNVANKSLFTYTYSVIDDDFHKFDDYSYSSSSFDDNQSGIIDFEIPSTFNDYIIAKTFATEGLEIDSSGTITAYNGSDSLVVIPDYASIDNHDGTRSAVKVTGIDKNAFAGKDITGIAFSNYITSIPEGAFAGCSELWEFSSPGVTEIGKDAFAGCSKLHSVFFSTNLVSLGENAFQSVDFVEINAANPEIVEAAVLSGANEIVISLQNMEGTLDGETLTIPAGTRSFALRGYGKSFNNLVINSYADSTKLNRLTIVSNSETPLQIHSRELSLSQMEVASSDIVLDMDFDKTDIWLYGQVSLTSNNYCVLGKQIELKKVDNTLFTQLSVEGEIVLSDALIDENNLLNHINGELHTNASDMLFGLHSPYMIYFNLNEGQCDVQSMEVQNNKPIGMLPIPTRTNFIFDGWFIETNEGMIKITDNDAFRRYEDLQCYGQWKPRICNIELDANEGSVEIESVNRNCGDQYGDLPTASRDKHFFEGWFSEPVDGTKIEIDSMVPDADSKTLYAHWSPATFTISFDANGGYSSYNSKTPYYNQAIGELPTANKDYHYFVGWFDANGTEYNENTVISLEDTSVTNGVLTLYAHYQEKEVIWMSEYDKPADAQLVNEYWTYRQRFTTTSENSYLDGWNQTGSYWEERFSGGVYYANFPSGFDTSHELYTSFEKSPIEPNDNGYTRRVVNNQFAGYIYYVWGYNRGTYSNTPNKTVSSVRLSKGVNDNLAYIYFYAFTSNVDCPYLGNDYCNNQNMPSYDCTGIVPDTTSQGEAKGVNNPRFFRFEYYLSSFKDYRLMYTFERYENHESSTPVYVGGDIVEVNRIVGVRLK